VLVDVLVPPTVLIESIGLDVLSNVLSIPVQCKLVCKCLGLSCDQCSQSQEAFVRLSAPVAVGSVSVASDQ
jgi:hypothetical protein